LLSYTDLPARILYTWADLYSAQLSSGQDYGELRPTYAIWLLPRIYSAMTRPTPTSTGCAMTTGSC